MSDIKETIEIFYERRTIVLGEINNSSSTRVIQDLYSLQAKSNDPIRLIIDSTGGSVDTAYKLCDIIEYIIKAPIHAVCVGNCDSSAILVLLSCSKRFCSPNSTFLAHSHSTNLRNGLQLSEGFEKNLENFTAMSRKDREKQIAFFEKKLRKTREEVKQIFERCNQDFDCDLSAQEALELGLVDEILTEKLDIF